MISTLEPRTQGMAVFGAGTTEAFERGRTASDLANVPDARADGIDLVVIRVSLAALTWARLRADRARPSREEQQRRYRLARELERRDHHLRLLARAFYDRDIWAHRRGVTNR